MSCKIDFFSPFKTVKDYLIQMLEQSLILSSWMERGDDLMQGVESDKKLFEGYNTTLETLYMKLLCIVKKTHQLLLSCYPPIRENIDCRLGDRLIVRCIKREFRLEPCFDLNESWGLFNRFYRVTDSNTSASFEFSDRILHRIREQGCFSSSLARCQISLSNALSILSVASDDLSLKAQTHMWALMENASCSEQDYKLAKLTLAKSALDIKTYAEGKISVILTHTPLKPLPFFSQEVKEETYLYILAAPQASLEEKLDYCQAVSPPLNSLNALFQFFRITSYRLYISCLSQKDCIL